MQPPDPARVARHARWRKWFWVANYSLVPLVALQVVPAAVAVAYLVFLSVQALVESAAAVEQGAENRADPHDA